MLLMPDSSLFRYRGVEHVGRPVAIGVIILKSIEVAFDGVWFDLFEWFDGGSVCPAGHAVVPSMLHKYSYAR